jgi:hypothetical protein
MSPAKLGRAGVGGPERTTGSMRVLVWKQGPLVPVSIMFLCFTSGRIVQEAVTAKV